MDPPKVLGPENRAKHAEALTRSLTGAIDEARERRSAADIQVHGAIPGLYVQFESRPGISLDHSSLESVGQGIELVAVTYGASTDEPPQRIERATVFVPDGKVKHFLTRFEAYALTTPKVKGERRYEAMLDPVATLRLATLRGLWTDAAESYPAEDETIWWETWLRRQDGAEFERLVSFAGIQGLDVSSRRLQFDDRIVTLVRATASQLAASIDVLNDLAEIRRAKETASFFLDMGPREQSEWMKNLDRRTTLPPPDAPAVCVLDTGVSRGHPLLSAATAVEDCHCCDADWGTHDHNGHGTEMAGLALYGDLTPVLATASPVHIRHRLESVKILPPPGKGDAELYGSIVGAATCRVEIQEPFRRRCFSMAVTATDERDRGQPTSWSAAIDALAAGRNFNETTQGLEYLGGDDEPHRRLFIVSAGNIQESMLGRDHLDRCDIEPVHDPAQAWNALTVGAYTDKVLTENPDFQHLSPLAAGGELSPWSTTGVAFAEPWPLKPDVVLEGGNVLIDEHQAIHFSPDLCLLSTYFRPASKLFVASWATSAATAQAARIAGVISAEYPSLWPEAVRALVVHSAEWTPAMLTRFRGAKAKRACAKLVRRYGFGVPRLERALRSARDALTMIVQDSIRPFESGKMREMHLFDLPWPKDVLASLGASTVRLRITLSYFIEPNPGNRGWKKRHRYASHGLRFEVKKPTELIEAFRKRLNRLALEKDEERPSGGSDNSKWCLGDQARHHGSIHSDTLETSAVELAERGVIGIYPVSGWWKDQPNRDRSKRGARYALIVSIETPGVDTDIWTPVAQQIGAPIETEANVVATGTAD